MKANPDQSTGDSIEEGASVVEEGPAAVEAVAVKPKKAAPKKKATVKRKKPGAKSKRPRKAAKPVVEPAEQPLTMQEVGETWGKAKAEFVGAVAAPAMKAFGRYSQMARDALAGAVGGFLGNKKRED